MTAPPDRLARRPIVLIADDSADDRLLVTRALSRVPVDPVVVSVNDGVELMAYLSAPPSTERPFPDLILLDLKMPRKNGLEVLAALHEHPRLRHVPVVTVFSTASDPELVTNCYAAGANAFIPKPNSFRELVEAMTGLLTFWTETALLPEPPAVR